MIGEKMNKEMKIGIPQAMSYYNYFPYWYGFFNKLGISSGACV